MAKERKDTWTAEEDAVVAQVLIDGALAGETQKMSITRASHAINRTYQAVAFRWYGEIRKAFEQEFADAKKQSRYRKGQIRSVRVPDHVSDFESKGYKLTDKVIGDVLGKKAEAIPLSEMFKELPVPKAEQYDDRPPAHKVFDAPIVEGVGKDEPIVVNEKGGGQSASPYRMDLLDPRAILATSKVLKEGADKYGAENWRLISIDDHLNHLIVHAYAYLAGDKSDEHLSHAVCRALFALGVELQDKTKQQGE